MTVKLGNEAHFDALFHYLHSLAEEREQMHQSYIKFIDKIIQKI